MATERLYLDWNATAPMKAEALAQLVAWAGRVGNPSSVHAEGRSARAAVEQARRQVAALVGAKPQGVTFTSGGTEGAATVLAPDWTLFGKPFRFDRLFVSAVEHPCVARGGRFPADRVETVPVLASGVIDLATLEQRLSEARAQGERVLVSVMLANNETGAIQPIAEVARLTHEAGGALHSDAVQAAGKIPVSIEDLGIDVLTVSAHKIGGPQGAGAIVRAANGFAFPPLVTGGGQESYARAGTENVAGIAAFGAAAAAALKDVANPDAVRALRDHVEAMLRVSEPGLVVFSEGAERLPNTVSFAAPGLAAETAMIALDLAGVAVSSGSACSSGKVAASPVLAAMGVAGDIARGALRVSLGPTTTASEVNRFLEVFARIRADMTNPTRTNAA